ncbi:hypothetical protein ACIRG4_33575 [Streptomyces sp. NPDC102395]|uniref:hypothetical protein n=1 Tax=Streptomyces sp. NPDC102395 TaxID=3366168 RepID=UPI003809C7D7
MSPHACLLTRPSRPLPSGAARTRVLGAASFAALATPLAAAGHHLAFASTAPVAGHLVVALALFVGRLLRPPRERSLAADLGAMLLAQASACCWLACLSDPTPAAAALHGEMGVALYLVMTLVTTGALRAAAPSGPPLSVRMQEALRAFAHRLCALASARTPAPGARSGPLTGARGDRHDTPVPETLPTGAAARRGPPPKHSASTPPGQVTER